MDLKGAVGIVTGGGTGIGRAVAEALARAGAAGVAVNYSRSEDEAEATAELLRGLGCQAHAVRADVARDGEARAMVEEVTARYGRLDVLVNNAGTTSFIPHADLEAVTDEVWDAILGVNVKGAFHCARAAAPHLRQARGAIVNVASVAAYRASGSSIPYGVSKAALLQLTRNLAVVLAPEVRVNAIAPGLVETRWFRRSVGEERARREEEARAAVTPLRAVATPADCAAAIMSLLQADFVTGESLLVDGGLHLAY